MVHEHVEKVVNHMLNEIVPAHLLMYWGWASCSSCFATYQGIDNSFLNRDQIDKIFARQPAIHDSQLSAWEAYIKAIDSYRLDSFGVILVDGRF